MNQLLRYIRAAVPAREPADVPDQELLDRFARDRDEAAFAALVGRYGGSVWSVCRRLVDREHDAEDAFQATFLTLARKAGSVRGGGSLPGWLHGVARRIAANLRRDARRQADTAVAEARGRRGGADLTWQEGLAALDEELARLPGRYRAVLIACCLDGRSRDEAAAHLGWSAGQVKGRLERAREMLRRRLERRGLSLVVLLLSAAAGAPASLLASTAKTAVPFVSGSGATADVASAKVTLLVEGALKTMLRTKLKIATAALLVLGMIGLGGGLLTYPRAAAPRRSAEGPAAAGPGDGYAPRKAANTGERGPAWGKPLKGLRLGLCRAEAKGDGTVRLLAVLENVSDEDLVVNLGLMLGNGKKQLPTAVRLIFTDAGGKKRVLRRKVGGIAGRVDPFGVPLAAGGRYTIACDLEEYQDEDAARVGEPLAPGRYRVTGEFVGQAPTINTTGLALMTFWTGTVESNVCQVTLPAKPAK